MRISQFARAYGRQRAGALMEDACRIERPGPGEAVYNPTTRKVTTNVGTVVYQGACRIWSVPGGGVQTIGDQKFRLSQTYLSIPWNAAIPEPEDRILITISTDPELVGRTLRINSVVRGGGLRVSRQMNVSFIDFEAEDL